MVTPLMMTLVVNVCKKGGKSPSLYDFCVFLCNIFAQLLQFAVSRTSLIFHKLFQDFPVSRASHVFHK